MEWKRSVDTEVDIGVEVEAGAAGWTELVGTVAEIEVVAGVDRWLAGEMPRSSAMSGDIGSGGGRGINLLG